MKKRIKFLSFVRPCFFLSHWSRPIIIICLKYLCNKLCLTVGRLDFFIRYFMKESNLLAKANETRMKKRVFF